jgi:hypothetical protein
MRGKRFWSLTGLVVLVLSTGCHSWCDHHYPCQERGYAAAAPACVPCTPCCPTPVPAAPVAATAVRPATCCP